MTSVLWREQRNPAILAAIRRGLSPQVIAEQYWVSLRAVLAISKAAEQRARFIREQAESRDRTRVRTLGNTKD